MLVQVVDALRKILGNGGCGFEIGIVESCFLQYQEPGLDQIEPGSIRWCPEEFDVRRLGRPKIQCPLVGAEVIPDQVDFAVASELWQYRTAKECQHGFTRLARIGAPDTVTGVGSKGRQ